MYRFLISTQQLRLQELIFSFWKCGCASFFKKLIFLYVLDRFDVLILKIILKK